MLEPNWEQERPTVSEIQEFWNGSVFTEYSTAKENIERVRSELERTHVNGGCKVIVSKFVNHPVLHWFVSRNRCDEISLFENFLSSEIIQKYKIKFDFDKSLAWEWSSAYILDGDIARTLKSGGAYGSFNGSGQEAKDLGQRFCRDLFEDRYDEILVFKTYAPWADWFRDVAWDRTWIIVDKRNLLLWAILLTDTD